MTVILYNIMITPMVVLRSAVLIILKGREVMAYVGHERFWNGRDMVLTKNYGRGLYADN